MRALTPEQILLIADEFCGSYPVRVRSFSALAAAAAVPGARFYGVPVHASAAAAAEALSQAITTLSPLTGDNEAFARVCAKVYQRLVAEGSGV